jgi:hypothetical protein
MVYYLLQVTGRISMEGRKIKEQGGFEEVNLLVRQARPFEKCAYGISQNCRSVFRARRKKA